jgi:cytochrome c553
MQNSEGGNGMPRRLAASASLAFAVLLSTPQGAPAASLQDRIASCPACHGEKGQSSDPAIPSIAGQPKLFVMYQLFFYREGRRKSAEMNAVAQDLTDADLTALANYVAALPAPASPKVPEEEAPYRRGAELARARICASCHNPDYSGREQMPRLAGQHEPYLLKSLQDYKTGARISTQAVMTEAVRDLSDQDLAALAYFLAHFQ